MHTPMQQKGNFGFDDYTVNGKKIHLKIKIGNKSKA